MNPEDDDRTIIRPPGPRTGQIPASPGAAPGAAPVPTQTIPATMPMTAGATAMPTSAATSMPTTAAPSVTTGGPNHALTLEAGTRLGEFEVTKTIGEGGFGIVYLAWDHSLDRKVALKEYMPTSLAYRAGPTDIKPRSERHRETFEAGLKSFINEAKLLAQFDHPSLLKVYRFWEANGTAYMVMPFLEGATVRDSVRAMPGPPEEAWILGLLAPLFDALAMLHASQIYHRDIAPDNVLLMADTGRPLLLDFGAARRVIGDMTQALTAILKPGYAPVEQYADMPGLKQGPWTDVYALAAVVHWMIMGKTPPPSVGRLFDDPYVPLAQSAAGRYSDAFLRAIDHGLAVMPEKRTTSIEAMRIELFGGSRAGGPAAGGAVDAGHGGAADPSFAAAHPDRDAEPRADAAGRAAGRGHAARGGGRAGVGTEQQDAARRRRHRPGRRRRAGGTRPLAEADSARHDGTDDDRRTGRRHGARGIGRDDERAAAGADRGGTAGRDTGRRRAPGRDTDGRDDGTAGVAGTRRAAADRADASGRRGRSEAGRSQAAARDAGASRRAAGRPRANPAGRAEAGRQQRRVRPHLPVDLARPGRPVGHGPIPRTSLQIAGPRPVQGLTASAGWSTMRRRRRSSRSGSSLALSDSSANANSRNPSASARPGGGMIREETEECSGLDP